MELQHIRYLISKLFNSSSSLSERAEVAKWINSADAESDSRAAWDCSSTDIDEDVKKEIWKNIVSKVSQKKIENTKTTQYAVPWWKQGFKVAAIISVAIFTIATTYYVATRTTFGIGQLTDNNYTFEMQPGQKGNVLLADGTIVHLNSDSKISFSGDYNTNQRVVNLEGEAYFEVAKNPNKRFIVICNGVNVEALGTKFNVKAYPSDSLITTTLTEGKVKVSSDDQSVTLLPNDVATYNSKRRTLKESTVEDVNVANYWLSGQLVFNSEPLSSIATTIERMYNVKIEIKDAKLRNMRFTGTIQNNSLNNIMYIISLTYPMDYSMSDSLITLSSHSN